MRYQVGKLPIRLKSLIELACLYAACFLLAGFLSYVERSASDSYVLMRYLKFVVEHQNAFVLGASTMAVVYHYQGILKADTEIRCRILVGDRLPLIRLRYAVACLTILVFCLLLALAIQTVAKLEVANSLHLFAAFVAYIALASFLLGRRRIV